MFAPHLSKRGKTRELIQSTAKTNATTAMKRLALVFLPNDAEAIASEAVLHYTLDARRSDKTQMFTVVELAEGLYAKVGDVFKAHWHKALLNKILPAGLGALPKGTTIYLFKLEWVMRSHRPQKSPQVAASPSAKTTSPANGSAQTSMRDQQNRAPAVDVETAAVDLLRAFDRIDDRNGRTNYVTLFDLRAALAHLDRDVFDRTTNHLRRKRIVSLDGSDGRHQRVGSDAAAAGIVEEGHNLVFMKRRDR